MGSDGGTSNGRYSMKPRLAKALFPASHEHLEVRDVGQELCVHSLPGGTVGRTILQCAGLGVPAEPAPSAAFSCGTSRGALVMVTAGISSMGHRWGRNMKTKTTAISDRRAGNSSILKME